MFLQIRRLEAHTKLLLLRALGQNTKETAINNLTVHLGLFHFTLKVTKLEKEHKWSAQLLNRKEGWTISH